MAVPPFDRQRLKEVFADARALPASDRQAYLSAACAGNEALRQEVESLLSSDDRAKSFLESPAVVWDDDTRVTRSLEGQRIGPYQIASRIGAGGMGEVYQARDTTLNRQVAIKVLLPPIANDPGRLARFRREAQVLASLNHPHIAQIHGFEDARDVRALVMELVEGPTLADRIVSGAIPINEALAIASQIADALEAAHEQGIIHRDLKPANIKVREDGTVKVLDFGLAKGLDVPSSAGADVMSSPTLGAHATETGLILGTAAYTSPEQARGKAVDRRADLWSFGCVLYEMLTRQRAFAGDNPTDVLAAVVATEPDWTRLPVETPTAIRTLLRRCLEKNRAGSIPPSLHGWRSTTRWRLRLLRPSWTLSGSNRWGPTRHLQTEPCRNVDSGNGQCSLALQLSLSWLRRVVSGACGSRTTSGRIRWPTPRLNV